MRINRTRYSRVHRIALMHEANLELGSPTITDAESAARMVKSLLSDHEVVCHRSTRAQE